MLSRASTRGSDSGSLAHFMTSSSDIFKRPRDAFCQLTSTVQYLERSLLLLVIAASDLPLRTIKFCSIVFGVTLRLLVINTWASVSREQQTTPLTSDECHQLATVPRSCVYNTWRSHRSQHAMKPDIGWESRFMPTPPALGALVKRVPVGMFDMEKLEWCG